MCYVFLKTQKTYFLDYLKVKNVNKHENNLKLPSAISFLDPSSWRKQVLGVITFHPNPGNYGHVEIRRTNSRPAVFASMFSHRAFLDLLIAPAGINFVLFVPE